MKPKRLFTSFFAALVFSVGSAGFLGVTTAFAQTGGAQDVGLSGGALLEYEQNTVDIVAHYSPSVVAVNVAVRGQQVLPEGYQQFFDQIPEQFRPFFQQPGQDQDQTPQPERGSGSGFVVDDQGRILTNYHVVEAALQSGSVTPLDGAEVTVTFPSSDEEYPVRVVGANATYDLALLELNDRSALPQAVLDALPIPIADSDNIRVGEKAIAIGNPFGFQTTVTQGIVSGVSRTLQGVGEINIPLVQTDAPINPGNSGGPLLNSQGQLIGINTAIIPSLSITGERGNLGIGFAVPSNLISENLAGLEQGGFQDVTSRPRLGVSIIDVQAYPENVRQSLNLPEQGVVINEVAPGSAAAQAGLQGSSLEVMVDGQPVPAGGDVITAVDGTEVTSSSQLQTLIFSKGAGDTVQLTIFRGGEEQTVPVTLAVVPQGDTGGAGTDGSGGSGGN